MNPRTNIAAIAFAMTLSGSAHAGTGAAEAQATGQYYGSLQLAIVVFTLHACAHLHPGMRSGITRTLDDLFREGGKEVIEAELPRMEQCFDRKPRLTERQCTTLLQGIEARDISFNKEPFRPVFDDALDMLNPCIHRRTTTE